MYEVLKHAHSGLRWIALLSLLFAIINAFVKWRGHKGTFSKGDKILVLSALIFAHIQLLIGFVLYGLSPNVEFSSHTMGDSRIRFFTVEHTLMMTLGIAFITVGYGKTKRLVEAHQQFRTIFVFYTIGLALILSRIPWPGIHGAGWF